jgi:hypothetical protein
MRTVKTPSCVKEDYQKATGSIDSGVAVLSEHAKKNDSAR